MVIADLHIHSRYSRATSRDCDAPHLDLWARKKGIGLLGTGDFTHPAWREELREQLVPAEEGLYTLRPELLLPDDTAGRHCAPRFVLSAEISSIYKKNGRVRKVHNVILLPSLEAAEELSRRLERIGNIHSDGRPILGLDSRDLLELTLEACPEALFIPAHIWTPHFSLFGAFSGFDTMEECFEDLTPQIHAVETGLSSDPPMNWRVSALDGYTLVSNSDAHSPAKLGREGNLLTADLSYGGLKRAVETGEGFAGTLEFFPEEGKYHLDGHRNCGVCLSPEETERLDGKCPVCGKKITIGVQHRVEELADRPEGAQREGAKPFESLAPLPEVIAASTGVSQGSKKTQARYEELLRTLGPEFTILRESSLEDIRRAAGPGVAEGIRRLREGKVERVAGYDGAFGSVVLLTPAEIETLNGQTSLFGGEDRPAKKPGKSPLRQEKGPAPGALREPAPAAAAQAGETLNAEQRRAVESEAAAIAVAAGPGTGKTKTLTARIAHLIRSGVKPGEITAVTFTNQAAREMRERLEHALGGKKALRGMTVGTFHAVCLELLGGVTLLGEPEALALAEEVLREQGLKLSPRKFLQAVSQIKNGAKQPGEELGSDAFEAYRERLEREQALDFDDLLQKALELSAGGLPVPQRKRFSHLLVDEFQDVNDLQYELVRQWSAGGKSLFVIGDPDQSIYGFRGAGGRCFERLREEIPELEDIRLVKNYRSSPEVLRCALPVVSKNGGKERVLEPQRESGAPVRLLAAPDEFTEGIFIAKEIGRMAGGIGMVESDRDRGRSEYRSFSDIAVLCRTHRQAELVESCLRHDSIPCVVSGRGDFLEEREARGLLGFLRTVRDHRDIPALRACLTLVWDCLPETVSQAEEACGKAEDLSGLRGALGDVPALVPWLDALERFRPAVGAGSGAAEKPLKVLERWERERGGSETLEKLKNMAVFYPDVPAFLDGLLLGAEGDLHRADGKVYSSGAVRVMTLHASKGLEFPVVFLAGLKRGNMPLESKLRPADPAEERRLLFVGMTRARDELILLAPGEPSPFLEDLPEGSVRREQLPARQPNAEQMSLF